MLSSSWMRRRTRVTNRWNAVNTHGLGFKMVVTGDITQIDLPKPKESGLIRALEILRGFEEIAIVYLKKVTLWGIVWCKKLWRPIRTMKNKIKSNLVLILFILGAAILFVGLCPYVLPLKTVDSLVLWWRTEIEHKIWRPIQGTFLVSDEMTVKSYVNTLSRLGEQNADPELRQALALLSQYIKEKEFTRQRYPLVQVGFRIRWIWVLKL